MASGEGHKPWRCYHHPVSFNQTLASTQQVASREHQPLGQVSTRHCLARKRISVNWPVPHSQVTVQPKCTLANLPPNRQWKQDLRGTQGWSGGPADDYDGAGIISWRSGGERSGRSARQTRSKTGRFNHYR